MRVFTTAPFTIVSRRTVTLNHACRPSSAYARFAVPVCAAVVVNVQDVRGTPPATPRFFSYLNSATPPVPSRVVVAVVPTSPDPVQTPAIAWVSSAASAAGATVRRSGPAMTRLIANATPRLIELRNQDGAV